MGKEDEGSISEPGVIESAHIDLDDHLERTGLVTVILSPRGLALVGAAVALAAGLAGLHFG